MKKSETKAFNSIGNECSLRGVVGKIIGYPEGSSGGVVKFCTPHGTIIETGIFHLKVLSNEEQVLLKKYEADALIKNGRLYDQAEETIY